MNAAEFAAEVDRIRTLAPAAAVAAIDALPDQYRNLGAVQKVRAALAQTAAAPGVSQTRQPRAPRQHHAGPVTWNGEQVEALTGTLAVALWCAKHKLPADVVGRWVWLKFDGKPDEQTRAALKCAGFRWISSRGEWAHDCGFPSRKGSGNPRDKYGSVSVDSIPEDALYAAA